MRRSALAIVGVLLLLLVPGAVATADDSSLSRVYFFGECEEQVPTVVTGASHLDGCRGFAIFFGVWDEHTINFEIADEASDEFGGSWDITALMGRNILAPFSQPIGPQDTCVTNDLAPSGSPGFWVVWFSLEPCVSQEVVITFDEFGASNNETPLSNEYEGLGVTFVTDDASIWDGLTDGDPGNWLLDGPDGPQFLGLNGESYLVEIAFSSNVSIVAVLAARSNGSSAGDSVTITAFCGLDEVDSDMLVFGAINDFETLSVEAPCIDRVEIQGDGASFHPFGLDSLNITFTD